MKRISSTALTLAITAGSTSVWAQTDGWAMLNDIQIDEIVTDTSYEVKKTFPESLRNGVPDMVITGYVVPITPGADVVELILVSDMGLCPFCGDPSHGASLQVTLKTPAAGLEEGARITLRGDLSPVLDPQTWNAVVLENAVIITS